MSTLTLRNNTILTLIRTAFFALLFFTPLILLPQTSELFEFNKMIFVYTMTVLITGLWISYSISEKRVVFKRTLLDIPLLFFLLSQITSTFMSVDMGTSLLGYYGRFHGGLASTVSFTLLYWIFVATMNKDTTLKAVKVSLVSALIVCMIAIFEHFGTSLTCIMFADTTHTTGISAFIKTFDGACWSQDFQTRVFSTIGQPNWLAAWIASLLPSSIGLILNQKKISVKTLLTPRIVVPIVFFTTLVFTKSKTGLIAVIISLMLYTVILAFNKIKNINKRYLLGALISIIILFSTPWAQSRLFNTLSSPVQSAENQTVVITDSFTIRKIVWRGAIAIWKDYPYFGSGVETFALMFPRYQPIELNTTSEWDFVFNKAHNEYLHILSTSGAIGLITYLILIIAALTQIARASKKNRAIEFALLAGYITILITNIASFSVVVIGLMFFFLPAFSVGLAETNKTSKHTSSPLPLIIISLISLFLFRDIYHYWKADTYFKTADEALAEWRLTEANTAITKSISLNPREPLYWEKQSEIDSHIAIALFESGDADTADQLTESSLVSSEYAESLSPKNSKLARTRISTLIRLSEIDSSLLSLAQNEFDKLITEVPHNPELFYNYALLQIKSGQNDNALESLQTAIDLKPNYKNPRFARALILKEMGYTSQALEETIYIRQNIDPFDENVNALFESLTR